MNSHGNELIRRHSIEPERLNFLRKLGAHAVDSHGYKLIYRNPIVTKFSEIFDELWLNAVNPHRYQLIEMKIQGYDK